MRGSLDESTSSFAKVASFDPPKVVAPTLTIFLPAHSTIWGWPRTGAHMRMRARAAMKFRSLTQLSRGTRASQEVDDGYEYISLCGSGIPKLESNHARSRTLTGNNSSGF